MSPPVGGVYSSGIERIRSGSPRDQPSGKTRDAGRSPEFPSGEPASTHAAIVDLSSSVNPRTSRKSPHPRAGFHGGIFRNNTCSRIERAHGRASWYDIREKGAMSP